MNTNSISGDSNQHPTADMTAPQQALWWLKQGHFMMGPQWEKAHAICQTAEGTYEHDLVHALAHWIEGDEGNRDYWYAKVKPWVRSEEIAVEWQKIADHLGSVEIHLELMTAEQR